MIIHTALGSYAAVAWILTTFVAAGQMEGTLVVVAALGAFAAHERITTISIGAMTTGTMIEVGAANGTCAALCEATWVYTLLIDARLGGSTLAVGTAAKQVAMLQCVAGIALIANAQWTM